jgi:hypothetical protein
MPPWPPETIARWERRSRRVLLLAGILLLAAHLLPRPHVVDGEVRWRTPFDAPEHVTFTRGPEPLVPRTLAVVGLGIAYVLASRVSSLSRRGSLATWTSVGLTFALAVGQPLGRSWRFEEGPGWPWWDGSIVIPALGLLLSGCLGRRRFGRALCVLGGCVGLAPFVLAPAWDLQHLEVVMRLWERDELSGRAFVVARGLGVVASLGLLWFGLGPARARGRRFVAARLWLIAFASVFVAAAALLIEESDRTTAAITGWIAFLMEIGRYLAPMAGLVVGLFLVITTSRRPSVATPPAA